MIISLGSRLVQNTVREGKFSHLDPAKVEVCVKFEAAPERTVLSFHRIRN